MKFGVHAGLWMARWTDEIKPILKIVSDIGFDGVEISLLGMDQSILRMPSTRMTQNPLMKNVKSSI